MLSLIWAPTSWPISWAELASQTPAIPEVEGGLELIGRETKRFGGALRTVWTWEGIDGDGKTVTFKNRNNTEDYKFDPGFAQKNILLHPNISNLLTTYGGTVVEGQVDWPDTYTPAQAATGLRGALGPLGGGSTTNPMFGQEDFMSVEGTYSCRYAAISLADAQASVGTIFTGGLPGVAPTYTNRNWLKSPSPYQRRGPVFDITEIYWLSGVGGWPKAVYTFPQ